MSNWLKLEGDVCAVTGALGGMGAEICREFARNGANVVMLDLDEEKVKAAAADLAAEFGIHAEGYKMNATDEAEVQAAVDATIADFGHVDVLVNTAGILRFAAMEDLPLSDWEQVLNVNLTGYFITSQRFGREMIKAGQGRLVHISTVASHSPETFSGVYSSTKAGVNMMSKMLAAEWGPYGVRSNCVEPCFVKTLRTRASSSGPMSPASPSRPTSKPTLQGGPADTPVPPPYRLERVQWLPPTPTRVALSCFPPRASPCSSSAPSRCIPS